MNLQPTLKNELVSIRPLTADDRNALFEAASDPTIWEQHWTTDRWLPHGFKTFFDDAIESKGAIVIIDNKTQKIIGSSRYHIGNNLTDAVEIGWSFLMKAYWGGGYNRAFKSLMIEHALLSKENVLFLIAMDNVRSQKATEKLGGEKLNRLEFPQSFRKEKTHFTYLITQQIWSRIS